MLGTEQLAAANVFFWQWEVDLIAWIQSWMNPALVQVCSIVSMLGEELVPVAIFALIYFCINKKMAKRIFVNFVAVNLTNPMIKNIALRKRPYMVHENIRCLKPIDKSADIMDISAQGYSFPSGHAVNSLTMMGSLAMYVKNHAVTVISVVLVLLCGISRFCLGVHYPTDVIAGFLEGVIVILLMELMERKIPNKWVRYLIIVLLAVPGWFFCRSNDFYVGFGMLLGFIPAEYVEEKYVNFTEAKNPLRAIVRVVIALGLFVGLNTVLKLPFSKELLASATFAQYLIRTIRYALIVFLILGVYPFAFRFWDRKESLAKKAKSL